MSNKMEEFLTKLIAAGSRKSSRTQMSGPVQAPSTRQALRTEVRAAAFRPKVATSSKSVHRVRCDPLIDAREVGAAASRSIAGRVKPLGGQ